MHIPRVVDLDLRLQHRSCAFHGILFSKGCELDGMGYYNIAIIITVPPTHQICVQYFLTDLSVYFDPISVSKTV